MLLKRQIDDIDDEVSLIFYRGKNYKKFGKVSDYVSDPTPSYYHELANNIHGILLDEKGSKFLFYFKDLTQGFRQDIYYLNNLIKVFLSIKKICC